ncbi:MAG: carboxypeptidase regulatory-like domain-containing protein [Acidobacteriaceae bacterium]|nr:carboxypeptidase regulatory-like domain-containing protein [Acidobacteriaceae bacterium]
MAIRFSTLIRIVSSFTCAITATILLHTPLAEAQNVYGSIVGTVTDASGAVMSGAKVTLTNSGTNERRETASDTAGDYQFLNLLPGQYQVEVKQTGFKRFLRNRITVQVQDAVRIDAHMDLGDTAQTVEVTAQTPLLQTQDATLGQVVESRQVQNLALNGRNVLNLISLAPGVVPLGQTGGNPVTNNVNSWGNYQIGGGAANQSATYIDGAPINVSYVNGTALVPTQEAIQEFKIDTSAISPEFGRFAGGIVNMSTRTGTSDAYEFLCHSDLIQTTSLTIALGRRGPSSRKTSLASPTAAR